MRSALLTALCLTNIALADDSGDRHRFDIVLDRVWTDTDSSLGAWPAGGFGKLRYAGSGDFSDGTRIAVDYRGRISDQIDARIVVDYIDDAGESIGPTEAYVEWRPLPSGPARHRYRFGAFYPAFSLENSATAWESPYSRSFSAANAWFGEEVRAVGAEWRWSRPLGGRGSPHQLGAFAGGFYGNDPAGSLLFWRGWSVHDRQTRLNERLPLPPLVMPAPGGGPDITIERRLDPIAEIDDRPGVYVGSEWSYAESVRLSFAFWDNRGDPHAFRDSQWAWGTRFWQLGAQFALPADIGLVAQHVRGDTDWLIFVTPTGAITPATELVTDEFESSFVLLTRLMGSRHRLSLRHDVFDLWRPGQLIVDRGHATTLSYAYTIGPKLALDVEWIGIESSRDLWPLLYGRAERHATERLLQLGFRLILLDSRG